MRPCAKAGLWAAVFAGLSAGALHAQETPLSAIDWLGTRQQSQPALQPKTPPKPRIKEAPVAKSGATPQVTTSVLGTQALRSIGLVPPSVTGLPADLWARSAAQVVAQRLDRLPELDLPAASALLYAILLTETDAPVADPASGETLALARTRKLIDLGAVEPARALIEQAGATRSPDHFALWMDLSLLVGDEDAACTTLLAAPHLTRSYALRMFCEIRAGNWENAALTFGSAQALGLMDRDQLDLFDRFLNPDLFEDAAPLRAPARMDPLTFRVFESIGEALPTRNLPKAYAVADLRDQAGWKPQLEAAERLARAGALPDNRLLGLYTEREPAASGGIWDRVEALQRFETALTQRSLDAITKTLPPVWRLMQDAELEPTFASLFASQLRPFALDGQAGRVAFRAALLSPEYETAPAPADDPDSRFLRALAQGEPDADLPDHWAAQAVVAGFTTAIPRAALMADAKDGRLGEALLQTLKLLHQGAQGDTGALSAALASLRALGLENTARRAALEVLLLKRGT